MTHSNKSKQKNNQNPIQKLDFEKVIQEKLPFTIVLNSVIQNIKNAEAFHIWCYLYSKPGDWKVIKKQIQTHFKIGNTRLRTIFSYLNRANLIKYIRWREKNGKLSTTEIHVLNGCEFKEDEPFQALDSKESKTNPVEILTRGSITRRLENQPSGSGALQKKENTKKIKEQKKDKSFYANANNEKHSFAESMNQMATEKKNIEEHEKAKYSPMPDNIRQMCKRLKKS